MFRILPVNDFADRKKRLIAQSELQRQALLEEAAEAQQSIQKYAKRVAIVGLSSVAMRAGLSAAKMVLGGIGSAGTIMSAGGAASKVVAGMSLFRHLKSLFSGKSKSDTEQESG